MKLRKTKRTRTDRMSRRQRLEYYENIDRIVTNLTEEDRKMFAFAKDFVNELMLFDPTEGTQIQVGPLDLKSLQYFAFSILMEYDIKCRNGNI